jgi:16S rRNA (cytosine1402-N4)-methyltransferase
MSQDAFHEPVMVAEVLGFLGGFGEGVVLDATVGGAGYAEAVLSAHPDVSLIGIDRDLEAVEIARKRLARFGDRAHVVHARFDSLSAVVADELAQNQGFANMGVIAVLFDLGVSSHQLDCAGRGFSYRLEGPLDMRMDQSVGLPAAEIVNGADVATLEAIFSDAGEERFAKRIAMAVVGHRPIATTVELANIVSAAIPAARRRRGHPARRVFQALRIAVNGELDVLGPALESAMDLLLPGGRLVVCSYHSGEDRLVKERLARAANGGCTCPAGLPCVCGAQPTFRVLTRGARLASAEEIAMNPRADAARLRVGEKLVAANDLDGAEF